MNPFAKYGIDRDAERHGVEVPVDDMVFIVRSASAANRGYRYALAVAANKRRGGLDADPTRAFDTHEDILIDAFADAVIVGWRNVDGPDGQPLEFNRENCIRVMYQCPDIWDAIRGAALDNEKFKQTVKEDGEALGKS
jgi:hypothetical protein